MFFRSDRTIPHRLSPSSIQSLPFPLKVSFEFALSAYRVRRFQCSTNWRSLFSSCRDVSDMYLEFVDSCTFLNDRFTPLRRSHGSLDRIGRCIDRLESRIARGEGDPAIDNEALSRGLRRAALRKRTVADHKLDFRDAGAFFRYFNDGLKGHGSVPAFRPPSSSVVRPQEKANLLAEHFGRFFNPPQQPPLPSVPSLASEEAVPDESVIFTEEVVLHHLAHLSSKGSLTPDRIFLKTFSVFVCELLALIFQRSYEDGVVPNLFRTSFRNSRHRRMAFGSRH